jgi:hypothetical protein
MCKYIVVKGRNTVVGRAGCEYAIFDIVSFCDSLKPKELETAMRKYVFRQLVHVDNKSASHIRHDTWCRRRHILKHDGSILVKGIKVWDHESGLFYGFIPENEIANYTAE